MSEQPTTQARPASKGGGKKIAGLPRQQAIGLGLVAAGGLLFLLWRARKNAKAAAQQQQGGGGTCPDGSAPDANGNCPQSSQDFSGQLDTLQAEIAALQGAQGGGGSGGGSGTVGGSTAGGSTGNGQPTTTPGTTSGSPGTTATGGSGTGTTANWHFPAPTGLSTYSDSKNGYRLRWNAVTGPQGQHPTGYTVATYNAGGQQVDQFVSGSTDTAEYGRGGKGLPKGVYHTNVWANGGPQAPPHATVFHTVSG